MRKITIIAAAAAASMFSAAYAAEPAKPAAAKTAEPAKPMEAKPMEGKPAAGQAAAGAPEMAPLKPGAEQKDLKNYFGKFPGTKGHIAAGMMGPNSPEVPTSMKSSCKDVMGGLYLACDIEDQMTMGKKKESWKGHMLAGWDVNAKMYKGVLADNFGDIWNFDGKMDGKKFIWETPSDISMMGQTFKDRLTFDMTDPKNATFTEEHKMASGGDWVTFETTSQKGDEKKGDEKKGEEKKGAEKKGAEKSPAEKSTK